MWTVAQVALDEADRLAARRRHLGFLLVQRLLQHGRQLDLGLVVGLRVVALVALVGLVGLVGPVGGSLLLARRVRRGRNSDRRQQQREGDLVTDASHSLLLEVLVLVGPV